MMTADRKQFSNWAKQFTGGQISVRGGRLEANILRQRFRWRSQPWCYSTDWYRPYGNLLSPALNNDRNKRFLFSCRCFIDDILERNQ